MKLSGIERSMLVAVFVCLCVFSINIYFINSKIQEAGGVKSVIVSIGKEINSIKTEINAE